MKKILILSNITSLIISITLLGLYLTKGDTSIKQATKENDTLVAEKTLNSQPVKSNIGYIDIERFQENSFLFQELKKQLEKKQISYKNKLEKNITSLKSKINRFKSAASNLSNFEVQIKQEELANEEKKIYALEQELQEKFQEEQSRLNEKLINGLNKYIEENYADNDRYQIIIGTTQLGTTILKYDKRIELTEQVIAGMNDNYKSKNP